MTEKDPKIFLLLSTAHCFGSYSIQKIRFQREYSQRLRTLYNVQFFNFDPAKAGSLGTLD